MADFKTIVVEKDINPYHSLLASFYAGLAEMGMINQGSINISSRRAAEYLYAYLEAKDFLSKFEKFDDVSSAESIGYHAGFINNLLQILGKYDMVIKSENEFALKIDGDWCRICPKTVGGADIKGTFCPVPYFFETMLNLMLGKNVLELESDGIQKDGKYCLTSFKLNR